jgi:hypothetical protein
MAGRLAIIAAVLLIHPAARASVVSDQGAVEASSVASAHAGTEPNSLVSDQLSLGAARGSPSIPRTGFVSDRLLGSNELTSSVGVLYGLTVTRDLGAPASAGSRFPDRGGTIFRLTAGGEWQASPHCALIPMVIASPSSTTRTSATIPFQDATGASVNLAGDLQVRSSSLGAEMSAELDTLDAFAPELVVTATGGLLNYWSTQKLLKLQLANDSVVTPTALAQQCQMQGCSPEVTALLTKPSLSVLQLYAELDVTATIRRTDFGATGTAYAYTHDPAQLGFFGVAAFARGPALGDGVPLAPLQFSTQAHATQKLGRFRISGTGEYGRYVDSEGTTVSVSAKPAFDVASRVRLWATATVQWDELSRVGATRTLVGALGLRWTY